MVYSMNFSYKNWLICRSSWGCCARYCKLRLTGFLKFGARKRDFNFESMIESFLMVRLWSCAFRSNWITIYLFLKGIKWLILWESLSLRDSKQNLYCEVCTAKIERYGLYSILDWLYISTGCSTMKWTK